MRFLLHTQYHASRIINPLLSMQLSRSLSSFRTRHNSMQFPKTRCQPSPARSLFSNLFGKLLKMTKIRDTQWFLLSIIRLSELQASAICITTCMTELAFNSIHLILCALHHFWTAESLFKSNQITCLLMTVEQIERHFCV